MGWFSRNDDPKDILVSNEDEKIVEINELHDSEKNFRRIGDTNASMIQDHNRRQKAREYMDRTGNIVVYNNKTDRWEKYR
jgi:hypothetical protein